MRLPFEPLARIIYLRRPAEDCPTALPSDYEFVNNCFVRREWWAVTPLAHPPTDTEVATQLGTTPRTVQRWKHEGLSGLQADRAASALGEHPSAIWGAEAWARAS